MSNQWLESAKETMKLPALLPEIYGDLLKPGVKQAGLALETVVGLGNTILWPIALANARARIALERNLEKYREEIKHLPDEKVAPVAPEIGVPILEKLGYVTNEELSDLYVNLLAKASCIDTAQFAHPSFVNIINNLSPDEAVLLRELHRNSALPFLTAKVVDRLNTNQWQNAGNILTQVKVHQSFPDNITAYFSNLEGLGLIRIRRDIFIAKEDVYEDLEAIFRPMCEALDYDREKNDLRFEKGKIEITPFGEMFISACLTKLRQN